MKVCALFLALVMTYTGPAHAERPTTCVAFIDYLVPVFEVESRIEIGFTGDFREIPDGLGKELEKEFPTRRFYVAKMTYHHYGPAPVDLLLVLDKESEQVATFLWEPWFTNAPSSFSSEFSQLTASSVDEAVRRMQILGKLVAFMADWRCGDTHVDGNKVRVPLYDQHGRGKALRAATEFGLDESSLEFVPLSDHELSKQ